MAKRDLPSPDLLRQLLDYDPETGVLTWRARPVSFFKSARACNAWNGVYAGKRALAAPHSMGYLHGTVLAQSMTAHRVAWAVYHGEHPIEIDHVNGERADNRISNLRNVTHQENTRNTRRPAHNTSGVVGVVWVPHCAKWQASITVGRSKHGLGLFVNFADAVAARKAAELEHGFHENHGRAA